MSDMAVENMAVNLRATRRPRADKERPATKRNLENEKPISIVERLRKERNTERDN